MIAQPAMPMTRRRKWFLAVAAFVVLVGVGLWLAYLLVLPWVIRREVNAAFASVGLSNVRFDVRSASLFGTRLAGTGGDADEVGIGAVSVRYSPWDAINGELRSITVTGARLEIDLDQPLAVGAGTRKRAGRPGGGFDLPFERMELRGCALVLKRGARALRLPIDGAIVRRTEDAADLTVTSAIETSDLHVAGAIDAAAGVARITASASDVKVQRLISLLPAHVARDLDSAEGGVTFALDYRFDDGTSAAALQVALSNVSLDATRAVGASVRGVSGTVTFDDLLAPSTAPDQRIHVHAITVAGQELTGGVVAFDLVGPNQLRVGRLSVGWAGGTVSAAPFALNPSDPAVATMITLNHVGLREIVSLVTRGRATADGTVSGSIPVAVKLGEKGKPFVRVGQGTLRADAPGTLRLGDASEDFGDLMAKSDPSFESDPIKRELRESVVEAMRDFDYDLLELGLHPTGDGDVRVALRIHGRGRTGNRLPLHLGVNVVEGVQASLDAYLAATSGVFSVGK
jgi:hypothetical protein